MVPHAFKKLVSFWTQRDSTTYIREVSRDVLAMAKSRTALIERLFARHGGALQAFFRRRIRSKREAVDLTQEVYLRILRVNEAEVLNNPESYLFAVASNLVKEQAVLERRAA